MRSAAHLVAPLRRLQPLAIGFTTIAKFEEEIAKTPGAIMITTADH